MTSPPEQVTVRCPNCSHVYRDWRRASINLDLDPVTTAEDEDYVRQATTAMCPECKHVVEFASLIVRDDVWTVTA